MLERIIKKIKKNLTIEECRLLTLLGSSQGIVWVITDNSYVLQLLEKVELQYVNIVALFERR